MELNVSRAQKKSNPRIRIIGTSHISEQSVTEIKKVPDSERSVPPAEWIKYFNAMIFNSYKILSIPFDADTCMFSADELPREDLIEFWMKKQIPELLWLLENKDHNMGKIPKQVHTRVKCLTSEMTQRINQLIDENKTKYYLLYPELNEWINRLLIDNKDEVQNKAVMQQFIRFFRHIGSIFQ